MGNINDIYFDGYYKEIWKTIIPDELTVKETDFILSYFNLQPGDKVLDLMCGYGRHTLALARKGIHVTAVDNLSSYIHEVNETVAQEKLPVTTINVSVTDIKPDDQFDLVICMGNSLNFFSEQELTKLLPVISSSLKKGGHFLVNSWSVAEIVFKNFRDKGWSQIGDIKFLTDSKLLFHPTRIETESIFITADNNTEVKTGIDYIYSLNELDNMLHAAGMEVKQVYSIPGKKLFTLGEPRAYIIAVRS